MNTAHTRSTRQRVDQQLHRSIPTLAVLLVAAALMHGCAKDQAQARKFSSPDEAVQALTTALRSNDTAALLAIAGNEGKDVILSGDEVEDRQGRQRFLALYDEKHSIADDQPDSKTLIIGAKDWPFPIPIVRQGSSWVFDFDAGKEEILNRRIGRDELAAIQSCKAINDAQHEYALRDPNNDGVHEYAQKIPSDPGKQNGLYWPTAEGEKPSPLGDLMAAAAAEGYVRKGSGPTPYHGYCYRILLAQGPHAPNGAMDYVVDGKMILGFAVVAYPADYGNSGIMTFIMGDDGVVYQKDLGEETATVASTMTSFDPGPGWKKVD